MYKTIELTSKNSSTVAKVNPANGQLYYFGLKRDGRNVMWPGGAPQEEQPKSYGWPNTITFPFPTYGPVPNDGYITVNGEKHKLVQHGLRYNNWKLAYVSEDTATFAQSYTAGTVIQSDKGEAEYPASYTMIGEYKVENSTLHILLNTENTGSAPLTCAPTLHPAYMLYTVGKFVYEGSAYDVREVLHESGHVRTLKDINSVSLVSDYGKVTVQHDLGNTWLWVPPVSDLNQNPYLAAIEASTTPELLTDEQNKDKELSEVNGYRTLLRGEKATYHYSITIDEL